MTGDYDEIQTHLLILILKTQLEILSRLDETPMLVARSPDGVYISRKEKQK